MARNTITLNNQSSADIQGLIIQELPPISKPAQRTEVETIDGRDGDIVTPLGFAAYDKEFTIGLYDNYDINQVIAFFNSEGTVTFSNEPDKYYNYQIVAEIDFERLVRYRTAKVKMHCQPFKYSATEGDVILSPPAQNLITIPDFTRTTNGVTLTATDGTITITGLPTAATEFYVPVTGLNLLEPGSYTLTATAKGSNPNYCSFRLIGSAPSDGDSFGGRYVTFTDGVVTLQATLTATESFGYLWFYMNPGTTFGFSATFRLENDAEKVITGEGTYLTLDNTDDKPFSKFDLKGDALQDELPTPDNPVAIKVVTGEQNIQICGRNLAYDGWAEDFAARMEASGHEAGITDWSGREGVYFEASSQEDIYRGDEDYLFTTTFGKNTQYTLQFDIYEENLQYSNLAWAYTDGTIESFGAIPDTSGGWGHVEVTSAADKTVAYIRIGTPTVNYSGHYFMPVDTFMLEKGTSASEYEAYQGQSYDISLEKDTDIQLNLGSIELAKIDTYQDYIWKDGDTWKVHKATGKIVLDGTEAWGYNNTNQVFIGNDLADYLRTGFVPICDYYTGKSISAYIQLGNMQIGFLQGTNSRTVIKNLDYSDTTNFKSWLTSHNTTVYYVLATATDTAITDETLIGQLEALWALNGYDDQTILGVTATGSNLAAIPSGQTLKGDALQDELPTPDNPVAIKVVTGEQTVEVGRFFKLSGLTGEYSDFRDVFFRNTTDSEYYDSTLTEGAWYKESVIGKIVLDGTESWSSMSWSSLSSDLFVAVTSAIDSSSMIGGLGAGLSDHFKLLSYEELYSNNVGFYINATTPRRLWFVIKKSDLATADLAGWKAWLAANPTTVYYVLRTPTYTQITDETLLAQLEDLKGNAAAYNGRTHVISTAKDYANTPHIVAVEVAGSSDGTITNSGNIYSKPRLTIYGSGNIGVSVNGIEYFQIALGNTGHITIDTAAMEAYQDSPGNLQNRLVTGDYDNFVLNPGENKITFSGEVSSCIVENYSRWI